MISELKPCEACNGTGEGGLNAVMDIFCRRCKGLGTRAVPDVPELVTVAYLRTTDQKAVSLRTADHHTDIVPLVLHSQAAEIIRSMIPRVNNCGRYIAERNDGTLMYLNHGNTWQGCDNFIAAKDKEIERLKNLIDGDDCPDPDKIDALFRRAEAAEAKLAQYEAQEPVAWVDENGMAAFTLGGISTVHTQFETSKSERFRFPLYASPPPAVDLKAENERLREALQDIANLYQPRTPIQRAINIARIAMNMETRMTRDELREKVANALSDLFLGSSELRGFYEDAADAAIDTIFAALKEPTEEMTLAARHLMIWIHSDMPTQKDLALWCAAHGRPTPANCNPELNHAPSNAQQAAWVFQTMLTASPLAPEGGGT